MKCNNNKLKNTCGIKTPSRCVFYDLDLPEFSKLSILNECITIEETTNDLYNITDLVLSSIDTKELGKQCLKYKVSQNKYKPFEDIIFIKDILLKFEEEICELKNETDSNSNDSLELDFKCLTNPCNNEINSLKDLLQVLINEVCNLKNQIENV